MLMMKRLIIQFCVFASMLACASSAWADMRVRDFGKLDSDVDALVAEPVRDHNSGKYCAIVKIITTIGSQGVRRGLSSDMSDGSDGSDRHLLSRR